jgi:Xaa-Pro dipeptidase
MALVRLEPEKRVAEVPRYPDFPQAEWRQRINRAKQLMSRDGIDAIVLWKRENVRYFFGFQTTHWEFPSIQPAVGIIPLDGEPVIIVPDLLLINAELFTWASEIIYQPGAHEVPKERALPGEIAGVLKQMGLADKRIGLESGPLGAMWIPRPMNDIESFIEALPDAKIVDGDSVIWGCRMIKSAFEMDRIRGAVQTSTLMHSAIVEGFRPGMTEMDLGKMIHMVQLNCGEFRGGDNVVCGHLICNLEKEGVCDTLAIDDVHIGPDDYIQFESLHKHKGYWCDIARMYQVGPITEGIQRNYDLCAEALANAEAMVKPGTRISDLYRAATEPIAKAGIQPFEMAGHGIGMDIHEPPFIDKTNDGVLEVGMVIALEAWILSSFKRFGGEGVFGFVNDYVVTDTGYERMEGLRKDVIQVSHPFR